MSDGEKYHHGRTPAAWVAMVLATLGSVVAAVGFFMNVNWPVVIVGLAVVLIAPIVGGVMRKMGYGQA